MAAKRGREASRFLFVLSHPVRPIPDDHRFTMRVRVTPAMTASFFGSTVHRLYATFAIVEHAEYASRQAIISFLDRNEDAVGTRVAIEHIAPAPVGAIVAIEAVVREVEGRTIICDFTVRCGDQVVARGESGQRVVDRAKLRERVARLSTEQDQRPTDRFTE